MNARVRAIAVFSRHVSAVACLLVSSVSWAQSVSTTVGVNGYSIEETLAAVITIQGDVEKISDQRAYQEDLFASALAHARNQNEKIFEIAKRVRAFGSDSTGLALYLAEVERKAKLNGTEIVALEIAAEKPQSLLGHFLRDIQQQCVTVKEFLNNLSKK